MWGVGGCGVCVCEGGGGAGVNNRTIEQKKHFESGFLEKKF